MLTVGVCYEYLSECVLAHKTDYLAHTRRIQFVENIIEEQERRRCRSLFQKRELSQLQSHKKCLVLPLRPYPFYRLPVYVHRQIVTMYAGCRIAKVEVPLSALHKHVVEIVGVQVRLIGECHFFVVG